MIVARQLAVGHGRCAVIEGIKLHVARGEFVAVVGANGAGKTTLLKTLAGLLPALAGEVRFNDCLFGRMPPRLQARSLAFVDSETPVFGRVLVRDVVAMGRMPYRAWWQWTSDAHDAAAITSALTECGLTRFAERDFGALSSGEKQRVWIAAAFAQQTPCILLDEPTSRLDIRYAIEVLQLLRRAATRGAAIVASMHDLERAALFADRVIVLGNGRILADGVPAAALSEPVLREAFGVAVDVRIEDNCLWLRPHA